MRVHASGAAGAGVRHVKKTLFTLTTPYRVAPNVPASQGCTLPVMLLAAKPEYNAKVWLMQMLGAVTSPHNIEAKFLAQQAKTMSAMVRRRMARTLALLAHLNHATPQGAMMGPHCSPRRGC